MATTNYATNNPLAVKLWSKMLSVEALKATWIYRFVGDSTSSMIQIKDETSKSAGDQITYGLRMQLSGNGVIGDGTLEGQEEALTTYSDALVINQLRHAVRSQGRMSQQRVPFSVRDEALSGLRDWWADRIDYAGFNQLCGNLGPSSPTTVTSDIRWTGLNATIAPDANHYFNAAGTGDDTGLGSTNVFSLTMLDAAVERAKTLTPAIRPVDVKGKRFYCAWLHPYQVTDLRTSTATGQWLDIQKAAMTGGLVEDNPIFDGSLGVYNGIILHEDTRVSQGYNPTGPTAISTVRRGVFAGAQAAMIGFGRDNSINKFTWVEELFDYENQLGVSAGLIWGLKKTVFNSADFATVVMSSYATTHT
ncbi:MAG: N4-gp56 family major capsid protein [Bradyrhizobium sp.]|nr:N4-gp56 family major capsid protein [Bradyrhizobium sp.]